MAILYTNRKLVPFKQVDIIGYGAIGIVDEVEGLRDGTTVTLARKTILLETDTSKRKKQVEEIEKEVAALKKCQHKHIVQLVATYLLQDRPPDKYAIVMEPRADGNLEEYLTTAHKDELTREQFLRWINCLVNAVTYIHRLGIRHRDIKPRNILVHKMKILLTDFGISLMGLGETIPTTVVGGPRSRTIEYCSPDVEKGHTRGRAADIFSLGATFLEMLAADAGLEELKVLRKSIEVNSRQSFALSIDSVTEFMNEFSKRINKNDDRRSRQTTILSLCRTMLQTERAHRPLADDIQLWLLHKACFATAEEACSCFPTLAELDPDSATRTSEDGNEMLRTAYRNGHRLMVDLLIQNGANISSEDALVTACEGGMLDKVQALVGDGADAMSHKAFAAACKGGHDNVVKFLLGKGWDIDGKGDEGWTGLHHAASYGRAAIVKLLVERGATINVRDRKDNLAIDYAVANDHEDIALSLLRVARTGASE